MTGPSLQDAADIEELLRDNGYDARVTDANLDTLRYSGGETRTTGLTLEIHIN